MITLWVIEYGYLTPELKCATAGDHRKHFLYILTFQQKLFFLEFAKIWFIRRKNIFLNLAESYEQNEIYHVYFICLRFI
jgi:hypothetical protein